MDKIVHSLKSFRYTKEIKEILSHIEPRLGDSTDIGEIFKELYENQIINELDFMAMETKIILNRFTMLMMKQFKGLDCGIYLFDEKEKKVWNGSTSSVAASYNEYSHGLSIENDIKEGDDIPIYLKRILAVSDVDKSEDIVSLNHKKDVLKAGYKAFCCSPLQYNEKMIGHTVLFSKIKKEFTDREIYLYHRYNELIEEQLANVKAHILSIIKAN